MKLEDYLSTLGPEQLERLVTELTQLGQDTYACPHCGATRDIGYTCENPECFGAHNNPDGP